MVFYAAFDNISLIRQGPALCWEETGKYPLEITTIRRFLEGNPRTGSRGKQHEMDLLKVLIGPYKGKWSQRLQHLGIYKTINK